MIVLCSTTTFSVKQNSIHIMRLERRLVQIFSFKYIVYSVSYFTVAFPKVEEITQ